MNGSVHKCQLISTLILIVNHCKIHIRKAFWLVFLHFLSRFRRLFKLKNLFFHCEHCSPLLTVRFTPTQTLKMYPCLTYPHMHITDFPLNQKGAFAPVGRPLLNPPWQPKCQFRFYWLLTYILCLENHQTHLSILALGYMFKLMWFAFMVEQVLRVP